VSRIELQPPRGTRDFYPDDLRLRSWLFERFRDVARRFAFEEVDAPVVEHAELFTRKGGEEIVEQLFHFELHERHLALRPEMTPSIARMVLARHGALRFPLRWFAITQNWRYERMTRGRKREHYQWNMDVWGEPGVTAEAELLAAICALLDGVGLGPSDVRIRLSSRALLEETLRASVLRSRSEAFAPLCVVIDKLSKIGPDAVVELLVDPAGEVRLPAPDAKLVVALLGLRGEGALGELARALPDDCRAVADLRRLFELLGAYGIRERVEFDASIVRGLAYYTGVVFEAFDTGGQLRAVCGGGRYDGLLETLGGPPTPAVGFGFGDVVIAELLADKGLLPAPPRALDAVVFPFSDAERPAAIRLAARLRGAGQSVELALCEMKLKRLLQDADRSGARRVYLIGPEEQARGVARVKDLRSDEGAEGGPGARKEYDEPL
jgi:histidyl-tRNA synthetase